MGACPVSFLSPCHLHAPRPPQPLLLRAAAMSDPNAVEAPVTFKAYMMCAFASFEGIFFGYDSGYINGVLASQVFIDAIEGPGAEEISSSNTSLITSILSAGTFFGALIAGDLADRFGRRWTIISGCVIYCGGVVIQMFAASALATIVVGRLVAGFQFCITIGIMLGAIVNNYTQGRDDSGSYR